MVNVMKATSGWQVRAITRNPGSDASKALVAQGIGVVQADFDDEESLRRAFQVSVAAVKLILDFQLLMKSVPGR